MQEQGSYAPQGPSPELRFWPARFRSTAAFSVLGVRTSEAGSALAPEAELLPCEAASRTRSEISEDVKLQ